VTNTAADLICSWTGSKKSVQSTRWQAAEQIKSIKNVKRAGSKDSSIRSRPALSAGVHAAAAMAAAGEDAVEISSCTDAQSIKQIKISMDVPHHATPSREDQFIKALSLWLVRVWLACAWTVMTDGRSRRDLLQLR
jgi:hypothetical protein